MKQIIITLFILLIAVPARAERERFTTPEDQSEIRTHAVEKAVKKQKETDDKNRKKKAKQDHDAEPDKDKKTPDALDKRLRIVEQALGLR